MITMASLTNYKGLQVVTPNPSGAGGLAINDDFKSLVDWNPKCKWDATADPTASDDSSSTKNYQVGSLWFNSDTGAMFLCNDATESAAVWRGFESGALGLFAWNTTTDDTDTELFLNGVDMPIQMPASTTWGFTATAVARASNSAGTSKVWLYQAAIKRVNSDSVIVGAPSTTIWGETAAGGWKLSISGATGTPNLVISVLGETGVTIKWVAAIQIVPLKV